MLNKAWTKPTLGTRRLGVLACGGACVIAALFFASRPVLQATLSTFADARGAVMPTAPSLAQEHPQEDENEVAPEKIEKYIAVYRAMQRNHSLKIGQAAATQGLSIDAFAISNAESSATM